MAKEGMIEFVDITTQDTTAAKLKHNISASELNSWLLDAYDRSNFIKDDHAILQFQMSSISDDKYMDMLTFIETCRVGLTIYRKPIYFEKCGNVCYNAYIDEETGQEILELRFKVKLYVGIEDGQRKTI